MVKVLKKPNLGGAVYVLPNMLTTGNIFFGFFSIVKTLQGDFKWAASAIVLAAVFDVLDGRIARLTGGTSEFGVQYDSLCDLISFGAAPALLMYKFGLDDLGRPGWIVCFLYLTCGALRLARFNVQSSIGKDEGDFIGLPIPMAAFVISTFVAATEELLLISDNRPEAFLRFTEFLTSAGFRHAFLLVMGPLLATAMVSNFAYRSHKFLKIDFVHPFRVLSLSVLVLAVFAYEPELFGLIFSFSYAISGPVEWAFGWKKTINDDEIFSPIDDDDSTMEPRERRHENRPK